MSEEKLNQRRAGFLAGMVILAKNLDAETSKKVLDELKSFGTDLHNEIERAATEDPSRYFDLAPCPPGYIWDHVQCMCVPAKRGDEE